MSRVFTRIALVISGALLLLIGGALLISPKAFLASSEVLISNDPSLLSELVAPSGVLILSGALMILSAILRRFINSALSIGTVVYAAYGVSRLFSISIHGVPSNSLIEAMIIELVVAGILIALRLTAKVSQPTGAEAIAS